MQEPHETPEAVARWLSERTERPVDFEQVEPGDEQVLPDRDQCDLDNVPSALELGLG